MAETLPYCTFYLNHLYFGVEVLEVQEILRPQKMTRVPLSPPAVHGLINLRGQIVTALDLRTLLDLPPRTDGEPMNVVVRVPGGDTLSLLVDAIGDVVEVPDDAFEEVPTTLPVHLRPLITGVHKLDGKLLLGLDLGQTLARAN